MSTSNEKIILNKYEGLRLGLLEFLPNVGERVLAMRREASQRPDFARLKEDKTIVTQADLESEELIRAWINERFPEDAIRGEEMEEQKGVPAQAGGNRVWIVDPIDGTYNFSNTGDKFGISVGLVEDNTPRMGVIWYPAENISLSVAEGKGAFMDGVPIEVSPDRNDTNNPSVQKLGWSFTHDFLLFLQNSEDAIFHPGATPYDIGAITAIARELKFRYSDLEGNLPDFSKSKIPILISKNPDLHDRVIAILKQ